jgi:membrane associated rhomboid family serine protease
LFNIKFLKFSAIWVLPLYFINDFIEFIDHPKRVGNVAYHAHLGGFTAGTVFYLFVAKRLKQKYY